MIRITNAYRRRLPKGFIQALKRFLENVLELEGKHPNVHVILSGDRYMKALNTKFLNKSKPADVLTFPMDKLIEIYVNVDHAVRLGDFGYYTAFYALHGLLHALGYDHKRRSEAERMYSKQEEYMELWKW